VPLGNFTLDIQRFVNKAKGNVDLVIRKVALDLFQTRHMKSPVDTGRFKGNWQVAINSIPPGTLDLTDKDGSDDFQGRRDHVRSESGRRHNAGQ
jgi:hypothetical protein